MVQANCDYELLLDVPVWNQELPETVRCPKMNPCSRTRWGELSYFQQAKWAGWERLLLSSALSQDVILSRISHDVCEDTLVSL